MLFSLLLLLVFGMSMVAAAIFGRAARPPPQVGTEFSAVLEGVGSPLGPHEVLCVKPAVPPRAVLVFVPGNPGQPSFYSDFAERLCARLEAEVVVLGLAGHLTRPSALALGWRERRRSFTIHDQVAHVAARSAPYLARADALGVPCCMAGHSIGAWIALGASLRLQPLQPVTSGTAASGAAETAYRSRPYVLLLTPFLEAPSSMPIDSFRSKYRLITRWGALLTEPAAAIGAALGAAPEVLRRRVLAGELANLSPQYANLVLHGLVHAGSLRNLLTLARTEFAALAPSFDFSAGAATLAASDQLRALFVPGDEWAPSAMMARCTAAGVSAELLESTPDALMRHAFSVQPGSCSAVVDWVARSFAQMSGLVDINSSPSADGGPSPMGGAAATGGRPGKSPRRGRPQGRKSQAGAV
uniref:AB hydrolase-1 domain-containing protein n=1 Tax=Haptolina brevifila TaxID=156173 RepID=A0A7S2II70_9EUKA|mmetsp:Transcript_66426/g.131709  ORF Transcript_66426/g.131709 Transcript_66426/m.131709 type:complete len:414 (+) Transcript_66426:62-1303(+)